jgi:hypothetical protein
MNSYTPITEYKNYSLYECTDIKQTYNTAILDRNIQLMEHAISRTSQVLLIRFDVRYPVGYDAPLDNYLFQSFIEDYRRYLDRHKYKPLYLWCREKHKSERYHYHVYFLLDGNEARYMPNLSKATEIWCRKLNIPFTKGPIEYCNPNGTMIPSKDVRAVNEAVSWLGYLAKNYTKSPIPGIRNWNSSRCR